jgi:hypothetical protein
MKRFRSRQTEHSANRPNVSASWADVTAPSSVASSGRTGIPVNIFVGRNRV